MRSSIALVFLLALSSTAKSAEVSDWLHILELRSGWNYPVFNIVAHNIPNPANCSNSSYAQVLHNTRGRDTVETLAQMAFQDSREVQLVVDETSCAGNNTPKIIGIHVR